MIVAQGVRTASVWPNASERRIEWQATLDDGTEIQLLLYMDPLGLAVVRRFPGGSWESIRVA